MYQRQTCKALKHFFFSHLLVTYQEEHHIQKKMLSKHKKYVSRGVTLIK